MEARRGAFRKSSGLRRDGENQDWMCYLGPCRPLEASAAGLLAK